MGFTTVSNESLFAVHPFSQTGEEKRLEKYQLDYSDYAFYPQNNKSPILLTYQLLSINSHW